MENEPTEQQIEEMRKLTNAYSKGIRDLIVNNKDLITNDGMLIGAYCTAFLHNFLHMMQQLEIPLNDVLDITDEIKSKILNGAVELGIE